MTTHEFLTTLPERAVIQLTGDNARSFLQKVLTNGPEGAQDQVVQYSALLTPQGKVLSDLFIFDDGDTGLFLDVPLSERDTLIKRLTLYRLRAKAEIISRDDLAVAAARSGGIEEFQMIAHSHGPDPRHPDMGIRAIVNAGGPVDDEAYRQARTSLGLTEFGVDYGPGEVFSTDVNHDLMHGINYKKGCFVGQEVASRMHRKGGVRKRTIRLSFHDKAPRIGSDVMAGETKVGSITSTSGSYALARVRLDRIDAQLSSGDTLTVAGQSADWHSPDPAG